MSELDTMIDDFYNTIHQTPELYEEPKYIVKHMTILYSMDTRKYSCPICHSQLKAVGLTGKMVRCKQCKYLLNLPGSLRFKKRIPDYIALNIASKLMDKFAEYGDSITNKKCPLCLHKLYYMEHVIVCKMCGIEVGIKDMSILLYDDDKVPHQVYVDNHLNNAKVAKAFLMAASVRGKLTWRTQ